MYLARNALSRQGSGIQRADAFDDHAVDGHLLTRLDDDDGADLHLVRVDLYEFAVLLNIRVVRTDVHERADVFPAFVDGKALEQLADLIEKHNGDGLGIIAAFVDQGNDHSTDRRHSHKKVLVKDLSVPDALEGFEQDIVANRQIWYQVQEKPYRLMYAVAVSLDRKMQHRHQHGRCQNAPEHFFLFLVHCLTF